MKKKQTKKLVLNRETLTDLEMGRQVVGMGITSPCETNFGPDCPEQTGG